VEITHGRVQRFVPHNLLDGARISATFQAVACITVAQFMRQNRNAELTACVLDGPLHVRFVHPETDEGFGPRITADVVRREKPGPSPTELIFRVLPGQSMRERQWGEILVVALPDRTGKMHLLG
jgi:hypothetical protein